ncbi:hypothetical protein EPA93_38830 [Ktedonosporobacter rubrisoli]|uniref:Uncharacterized protein n=1 Tax=Ktedonosporobacter rubrisoli TaxID=2509675 RepID=A0A4P6K1B4_KTERU|nr:hypothetical protein [Ktedonosporobacter rubrisoli]QBD81612.1 hypothetical protein EPA93_38830 [Ktedonosporobacter rubrisoli]
MPELFYWGHGGQYGPFETQEDGWPNAGQVMRYFREKNGISAATFAVLYGEALTKLGKQQKGKPGKPGKVTAIWILNMEKQNTVPADITRRRVIAKLLSIPPALLGLASLEESSLNGQLGLVTPAVIHPNIVEKITTNIALYQKNVRMALHLHRTSNAHDLLPDIEADVQALMRLEEQARENLLYQIREVLISNYLLASRIDRDKRQYASAYKYVNEAVHVAKRMEDTDLLATAKHARGVVKLGWGQFTMRQGIFQVEREKVQSAMYDFQDILDQENRQPGSLHPQLVGFTMIQLGRAQGVLKQGNDKVLLTNALIQLDEVADLVGREPINDPYMRALLIGSDLHKGAYLLQRANTLNTLGLSGKAIRELNQLRNLLERTYNKDETRIMAWIDVVMAEALLGIKEYDEATWKAKEALIACRHIHSLQNIATIMDIQSKLAASSYGASRDVKELGEMLTEWYRQ